MPITADCHLHSSHSGDSDASMEDMIREGIRRGLTHMCFTEHNDFDFPVSSDTPQGMFELNADAYLYDLIRLREKYAGQIHLLFGVELGLQPHLMRQNAIFAKAHDYDFIIGSSHVCGGQDPYYPTFFQGRSQEEDIGNIFRAFTITSKNLTILTCTAIWTMWCAMVRRKTCIILMKNTAIYLTAYWNCCWRREKGWKSTPVGSAGDLRTYIPVLRLSAAIDKRAARSSPSAPMPMIPPRLPPISTGPRRYCGNAVSAITLSLKSVSLSLNAFRTQHHDFCRSGLGRYAPGGAAVYHHQVVVRGAAQELLIVGGGDLHAAV